MNNKLKEVQERYDALKKKHDATFKSGVSNESAYRDSSNQLKTVWEEMRAIDNTLPHWI